MSRKTPACGSADAACCCKLESLVSVDERGQMVLPKELREKIKLQPGDKLAVVSWMQNGEMCCLALLKADDFTTMVKQRLGPMMEEVVNR